jgi:hypothetical protein
LKESDVAEELQRVSIHGLGRSLRETIHSRQRSSVRQSMYELNHFSPDSSLIVKGGQMFTILALFLFLAMTGGLMVGTTGRIWQ